MVMLKGDIELPFISSGFNALSVINIYFSYVMVASQFDILNAWFGQSLQFLHQPTQFGYKMPSQ